MANAAGSKADDKAAAAEGAQASPVNPLMIHPAAAFAAASAIGFGFQAQMASAFFSAMQSMVDAGQKFSTVLEKQRLDAEAATPKCAEPETPVAVVPAAAVEPLAESEPMTAERDNVVPMKPVARKVTTPSPVVAKAEVKAKPVPQPKADLKPKVEAKQKAEPKAKIEAKAEPAAEAADAGKSLAEIAHEKPVVAAKTARTKADDLKRIDGIGPKLEQVLNGMGITRFADIVGWSEDDMKRIDAELGVDGRIGRDDWIGQAKALAGAKAAKK